MSCCPNEKQPMMLYRYTNLNNLALLLKTKKIRLASLNDLDDISESRTKDMGEDFGGKYVFVSSWTDIKEENLPFWNMYTPDMAGVRIGIPHPYLKTYNEQPVSQEKGLKYGGGESYIPLSQRHGQDYYVLDAKLIKIEYTNDEEKLNRTIYTKQAEDKHSFALGELGKYKKMHWAFQSEWRFRVIIIPSSPPPENINDYQKEEVYSPMVEAAKQIAFKKNLSIKDFHLEIDESAFSKMEILLGPKHKDGDLEIVKALVKTYNPCAKIEISQLSGDIR